MRDELAWFDVSSYGPRAVDAMLRTVGVDRLVLGSDRPVADPPALAALGPAVPLWRMGDYEVLPTGELRRRSLSYAEEPRPIGA